MVIMEDVRWAGGSTVSQQFPQTMPRILAGSDIESRRNVGGKSSNR